jgi:hypothetical protein
MSPNEEDPFSRPDLFRVNFRVNFGKLRPPFALFQQKRQESNIFSHISLFDCTFFLAKTANGTHVVKK